MRIAPCLVVSVFLGLSAMQSGFAQDRNSHGSSPNGSADAPDAAQPTPPAAAPGAGPQTFGNDSGKAASNPQDQARPKSGDTPSNVDSKLNGDSKPPPGANTATKDSNSPDAHSSDVHGKDFGPIDTRITTVQPRRLNARPGKTPTKFSIVPHAGPHAWRTGVPRMTQPLARNAIGQPISPRDTAGQNVGKPDNLRAAVGAPAATVPGAGETVKTVPGLNPANVGRPNSNPVSTGPVANRGAINGSGDFRHSSGPGVLGGPVKTAAGVNGTTIQRKH